MPPLLPFPPLPTPPPLLEVDITTEWGPGYALFLDDVIRMLCIQVTIQVMMFCSSAPGTMDFISPQFIVMLVYVVLGVALYWLVLKRLVVFK